MPVPRAARTAQRKSVVPDPDLYDLASDSDDSDAQQRAHHPPPKPAPTARKGKGPPPVRGSVTADNGRRRSSRLSNESAEGNSSTATKPKAAARVRKGADEGSPPAKKPAASKGKKRAARERPSSDEDEHMDDDEVVRVSASTAASKGRGAVKRSRVDEDEDQDEGEPEPAAPVASSSQAGPSAPRRGFIPRAAANTAARANKPPPDFSTVLVDSSADDPEPFPFTTNPPTPHVTGQAKRAAAKAKQNPRAKVPRTARDRPTESDEITPDDSRAPPTHPAGPSGSRSSRLTPPRHPSSSAPLHPHETPVQVKNIAFRQGPGTPATGGRTIRRSSARGSRNRGSSIGGGFEAVPHPKVADDKLYRSTDADDPLAKRLRSIVSWAAQRTRDRVFAGVEDGEMDASRRAAKEVMDGFIQDVCDLKVDTSVPYKKPSQSQDPDNLPPHPQNESNRAKLKELEASYVAIGTEQEARQTLESTYNAFFDRRASSLASSSSSASSLRPPALPSSADAFQPSPADLARYASSLDLSSLPAPSSMDDALELGRRLLAGEGVKPGDAAAADAGAGKRRRTIQAAEVAPVVDVMDRRILDAQIDTAHLRQLLHRLTSFTRVSAAYVSRRTDETHRALGALAAQGAPAASSSSSSTTAGGAGGAQAQPAQPGAAGASQGGLAGALATAGVGAGGDASSSGGALDMRDLLRAISRADAR
ncbi:hypothetical protein JCM8097_007366 [Rhodosporidiobolus ruineniae]